jgi:ring-1,2-phenylacetyl-CoA epoxidase subunit PaaA
MTAFPFAPSHGKRAEPSKGHRDIVVRLLERQGYRELAAAHVFAAGLRFAPTLDDKMLLAEQITEELEHFEAASDLYSELEAGDLLEKVEGRLAELPSPGSWMETAVVQFLFDRAGKFQLREYRDCSWRPYSEIVGKILAEEEEHGAVGEAVLKDLCGANPLATTLAQECFDRWLRISLLSFGRPGTPGDRRAVELGLKARPSAEIMRDYLADLEPTMAACGLRFPSREALGLEVPVDVPLGRPPATEARR